MATVATPPQSPRTLYFRLDEQDEKLPETVAEAEEVSRANLRGHVESQQAGCSERKLMEEFDHFHASETSKKLLPSTQKAASSRKGRQRSDKAAGAAYCRAQFVAAWAAGAALDLTPADPSDPIASSSADAKAGSSLSAQPHARSCEASCANIQSASENCQEGDSQTTAATSAPFDAHSVDDEDERSSKESAPVPSRELLLPIRARQAASVASCEAALSTPAARQVEQAADRRAVQHGTPTPSIDSQCQHGVQRSSGRACFASAVAAAVAAAAASDGMHEPASGFCTPRGIPGVSGFCTPRGIDEGPAVHAPASGYPHGAHEGPAADGFAPGHNQLWHSPWNAAVAGAANMAQEPGSPEWTYRSVPDGSFSSASHGRNVARPQVSPRTPSLSPRGTSLLSGSPADGSLLARRGQPTLQQAGALYNGVASAEEGAWRGWELQGSPEGRIFYHHAASRISQWEMPRELMDVLGDWSEVTGSEGGPYWYNEHLSISCWSDPRQCRGIHEAALDGNLFYIQLYALAEGSHDAVDAKGRSALHNACAAGQAEAALLLLQGKASVDLPDQGGSTPLHWACRYGHTTAVRLLLEAKASPDCPNMIGDTPMHEAAALGQVDPLHWLVLARADPHRCNYESRTPAQVAALRGWSEAEILLKRHEAHPCWTGRVQESFEVSLPSLGSPNARARFQNERGECGSEPGDASPVSPALKVVRAARPVLRGVQWLANRVLGEKPADLGKDNGFSFDAGRGQWVLNSGDAASDDEVSAASDSEDEELWQPSERLQRARLPKVFGLWKGREGHGSDNSVEV